MMDRELQRRLLEDMRGVYPNLLVWDANSDRDAATLFNLRYLQEHGLVHATFVGDGNPDVPFTLDSARITAAGLDFLAEDGGLGAILGVVTVRLEAESIREMLLAKVDSSDALTEEKSLLKKHLTTLPETALKAGTQELVKEGLKHLPDAIPWLRTLAGV